MRDGELIRAIRLPAIKVFRNSFIAKSERGERRPSQKCVSPARRTWMPDKSSTCGSL